MHIARIQPDQPATWPRQLQDALVHTRQWSVPWFNETPGRSGAYDQLHAFLTPELQRYALQGWHCTRLRDEEVQAVRSNGLEVLSEELLVRRIDAALAASELPEDVAARLRAGNIAGNRNRRGQLWFGFSRNLPGEEYIHRLFRYWGGEATYWAHEQDEKTASVLRGVGRPTIIDAWVPVFGLRTPLQVLDTLCQVDLQNAGLLERRPIAEFEAYTTLPVPADAIVSIHLHPGEDFEQRTGCRGWRIPL
jgi:hypothetical protein